jgi:hypothetical protein
VPQAITATQVLKSLLISGVATLLSVLTNRLGRIVDRARVLEAKLEFPHQDLAFYRACLVVSPEVWHFPSSWVSFPE